MIKNASNIKLNQMAGSLPDVSEALFEWYQPMSFIKVLKQIINYRLVETKTVINFRGVWQPMSSEELQIKSEGERSWPWFTVHSDVSLSLDTDDIIEYLGRRFRVMSKTDYDIYGYFKYDIVEDFSKYEESFIPDEPEPEPDPDEPDDPEPEEEP